MKSRTAKRSLALLLALIMAIGTLPGQALAQELADQRGEAAAADLLRQMGLASQEDGNSQQTNSVYSIHGKSYKVLFNDYIACYVDMDTGGYTILPAAEPLTENAPVGKAVFTIDGADYVFGGDYPEQNASLMPTRVRGDMAVTSWMLGGFFISQYQAITQDTGHEDSYAVKVAYLAEYLGDAARAPELSARMILPARLGSGADGVLYTDTGVFLAGPTVLTDVPGEMAMSAAGEGPRTFFVLDGAEGLPHPERMALGERAGLLEGAYPLGLPGPIPSMEPEPAPDDGAPADLPAETVEAAGAADLSDPAAAFDFPAAVLTIPAGDAAARTNQYGMLVNYGFYQLEAAELGLTVDEALTDLEAALTDAGVSALTGEETEALSEVSFELSEALALRDLRCQKPGESEAFPVELADNKVSLPAGSQVSFALELAEPECLRVDRVMLDVAPEDPETGEPTQTPLTPGADGRYSFTMPAQRGFLSASYKAAPGYVLLDLGSVYPAEVERMEVDAAPASRYALPMGKTVSVRLVADQPFFLNPAEGGPYGTPPGVYYFVAPDGPDQGTDAVSIEITGGSREQGADGAVEFSFVVPSLAGMERLGLAATGDIETVYHCVSSKVAPRNAVAGGALTIDAPKLNGIVRVRAGETVTIAPPMLESGFSPADTALTAYDLSNGQPILLSCGDNTYFSVTVAEMGGQITTFQMPAADVEVRLSGTEYRRVSAQVDYLNPDGTSYHPADMGGAFSSTVGVTILPEFPVRGQEVTVRLDYNYVPDGSGAVYNPYRPVLDSGQPILSGVSGVMTNIPGREYSFIMPDADVELSVTMMLLAFAEMEEAANNKNIRTLSTRPLVEGDAIRGGVWAWETYTSQAERPKPAQDGTSARIPAGATVEYYAYEPDYNDNWHIKDVYLARAETPEIPLEDAQYQLEPGYLDPSANTGYRTFTMPDFDCVIVVRGEEGRPIQTETYLYYPGQTPDQAKRAEFLDSMVRVYNREPIWGFVGLGTPVAAANAGQSIYVDTLEFGGYTVESLSLLRDGRAPEDIPSWQRKETDPDRPGRDADFTMGSEGVTIRVVYRADHALTVRYDESASSGVVKLSYPEGPFKAEAVYDANGKLTGYKAYSWLKMENILTETAQYTVESQTIGGVTVTVTPRWVMGWVGNAMGNYSLDYYWPATLGTDAPAVTIPIQKTEGRYGNTQLYRTTVNHTNPAKFQTVTITGSGLNAIDTDNIYLQTYSTDLPTVEGFGPKHDWTTPVAEYKVKAEAVTLNGNGEMVIDLKPGNVEGFPGFSMPELTYTGEGNMKTPAYQWAWGLKMTGASLTKTSTGFETKDLPIVEQFRLYSDTINRSDVNYYLSIMRSTANTYRMCVGRTESGVQAAPGETPLLSFFNQTGFFVQEDGSVQTSRNAYWEMGFNGSMTLSNGSRDGTLIVRQDEAGITVEARNLTLKALGVPLFIPGPGNAANKTLLLRLNNGTRYDLSAPADGSGEAQPLAFTSRGRPTIELLGWTGFTAGVDSITFTDRTVDVTGQLWLQWPFGQEQFGGMDLEQLRLKINSGQDVLPAFGGIHAEGGFQMPSLLVLEAGGNAIVNTFENHYEFDAEAEVGPVSFGGRLKLIESERFGLLVPDAFEVDFDLGDVGVPLVPPTIVAYITGLTGGYENLAETLDWDPIRGKTAMPDLRIIFGGHFQLLSVMSLDVRFNGGAYDVEGTVSGSIEIGGHGIDFFDYFTLWLGLRNVEGVPLAGSGSARYARLRAGVTTGIGLKISTEKIQDIVKGSTEFGVYIEFNNPVSVLADSIYAFLASMKDPATGRPMTLQDFVKAIDLTYVAYGTGGVVVQFPKIGPFGPFRIGGVHVDYDVGLKVGLNQGYQLAGAGYVRLVGTASVLGIGGYVVVDLLNDAVQVGVGAPPPFKGYRGRAVSDGALRVLADTEMDTGSAPMAFMALAGGEPGAAIYAGTDGSSFQYRFTLPDNGGAHLLSVRLLNTDTESTSPSLKLYDPRGTEVTLNQWDREGWSELALPQQDARFVVNAIYDDGMNSEDGRRGWLIAIPDQSEALEGQTGEWTLSASREVAVQLLEQEPMAGIAAVETSNGGSADPAALTLSADTVTATFENLQPATDYAYSLDLVLRDAPTGADLNVIQVRLGEDELPAGDMGWHRMKLDVAADGTASASVTLNAGLLPADLAGGTYYPVITLYRVDDTDDTGAAMTTPLDTAAAYPAITAANALFSGLEVAHLTVQAGPDQSLTASFDGVSASPAYTAARDAGWVVKGYQAALYGPGGIPVLAPADGEDGEDGVLEPVTARLELEYEKDQAGNLTLKSADTGHTLSLTGLTPGSYTVGVTPILALLPTLDMETGGREAFPDLTLRADSGVVVKAAEAPALWLEAQGGSLGYGENNAEILYAGPDFSLTIKTDRPADIAVRTLAGAQVLKSGLDTTSLTFDADGYFAADETRNQGLETLVITAVDRDTLGVTSRTLTLQADRTAPVLVLDQQQRLGAVGGSFTVTGRTRPGLTVNLLNAKEPVSAVADQEGRFTLNGTLPDDGGDRQMIVETTGASGLPSFIPVVLEELTEADLVGLELSPSGTISLTQGSTLALTVQGVKQDGGKVDLNAAALTFQTTGAHSVSAAGVLTAGQGSGTVTAILGSLRSNTLTVSGEIRDEPPIPSGGGGGGSPSSYHVTAASTEHGTVELNPKNAAKGSTVTVIPKPDAGYTVDTVLVTDSEGNAVAVSAQKDGTYTFTMPALPVTVTVTFKREADAWDNPFTDVSTGDWFYPYVEFVHRNGLFLGTTDATFDPGATMTRSMLWTVLARLAGQDTGGGETWYAKAHAWVTAQKISDGANPADSVTREQVALMLYRYAQTRGLDVTAQAGLDSFADASSVSSWAAEAMAWASAAGIVSGKPGALLDPQGQATRAELAAMLMRLLEQYEMA